MMPLLRRNLTQFEYSAYIGVQEILSGQRHTGRYEVRYADPVLYEGNISVPSGNASAQWFGIGTNYTHVLLMADLNADITEEGRITWQEDEYAIIAVRPSLNVLAIALRKLTKNHADPVVPVNSGTSTDTTEQTQAGE